MALQEFILEDIDLHTIEGYNHLRDASGALKVSRGKGPGALTIYLLQTGDTTATNRGG